MARTVDEMLAEARARLVRVTAGEARERQRAGALLVDVRLYEQRRASGAIPGAHVIALNHLEWRLDPASASRIPEAAPGLDVVVVCDEGYCSSLAAARLLDLGLQATDVIGGFQAWKAAGLPVEPFSEV